MLPNFIGIGAPKAATTWMFQCLQEHPDVFVADVKETDYFAYKFPSTSQEKYEQHFEGVTDETAVGELSTLYLAAPKVPERTYSVIPEAKLFVSLRNPTEQVYSHYWHLLRQNFHQLERRNPASFEEALEMYPDKLLGSARHFENLSRWLEHYDRSQLHVVLYEDISSRPAETLQQLFEFLDVDPSFRPMSLQKRGGSVRRGSSPRGEVWEEAYSKLYRTLITYAYNPLKRLIGVRRAEGVKNVFRVREIMEVFFRSKGYPEMNREIRKYLKSYFAEDIEKLEELVSRDLSNWK
jgi:hypothetical protein